MTLKTSPNPPSDSSPSSRSDPGRRLLVDSDAFLLFAACGLLEEAGRVCGAALKDLRRLDPLPHMLDRGRLARKYPPAIREKVRAWCSVVAPVLEAPRAETRELLIWVDGIDEGEALLFGLLFENPSYLLLSNDKRALRALRTEAALEDVHAGLSGRVVCVEVVLRALLERLGVEALATAVTPIRSYDGMINAVFSMGTATSVEQCREGLSSYFRDLAEEVGRSLLFVPPAV